MTERGARHKVQGAQLSRRQAVQVLGATAAVSAFTWTTDEVDRAARFLYPATRTSREPQAPQFFTPHEWEIVRLLVNIVIPRDERSGSATDAGVPEFIDFIMMDGGNKSRQTAMRGGLAWLDTECRRRFGVDFLRAADRQRSRVLDDIAYPDRARPEHSHGVAFFTSFRNLTASGFWSSKMGVMDLRYMGNIAVPQWTGCPDEQLRRLGVQ